MSAKRLLPFYVVFAMCVLPWSAFAQQTSTTSETSSKPEVTQVGYVIHQSTELGYRFQSRTGSDAMYETLVDLHQGPRILEQSLSMRSQDNHGLLFDNLSINSFGWGGDPENVLRARGRQESVVSAARIVPSGPKCFRLQSAGQSIKPTDIYSECSSSPVSACVLHPAQNERCGPHTASTIAAEFSPWIFAKQHDR